MYERVRKSNTCSRKYSKIAGMNVHIYAILFEVDLAVFKGDCKIHLKDIQSCKFWDKCMNNLVYK